MTVGDCNNGAGVGGGGGDIVMMNMMMMMMVMMTIRLKRRPAFPGTNISSDKYQYGRNYNSVVRGTRKLEFLFLVEFLDRNVA
jgi:hypothetical protein